MQTESDEAKTQAILATLKASLSKLIQQHIWRLTEDRVEKLVSGTLYHELLKESHEH